MIRGECFSFLIFMQELYLHPGMGEGCGILSDFPERFANGNPAINPEKVEPWGGEPTPFNFLAVIFKE